MKETIELCVETADGTIDCMLDLKKSGETFFYCATILYPEMVNGYGRSEIFCYDLYPNSSGNGFSFANDTDIDPKIRELEGQLSQAIMAGR